MIWLLKRIPYFVLALMAAYAAYNMPPEENPYAFVASSIGLLYGVYGMVGGQELHDSIVKGVVDDLLDFVPLAMVNVQIYEMLGNPYAKVHALSVVPFGLDLVAKLFGDACDDVATQTLKHVSNLANVISLLSLSYAEGNYMFGCVGLSYAAAHVGIVATGKCHGYLVDLSYVASYSLFYFATLLVITAPKE